MDEKFIENIGMSAHVDEGLWDRLKSRASSFTQGAKNISGGKLGAVGTTETAKFNSLFRNFVSAELSIIKSLDKALLPWAQHATPEEKQEIQQIETLEQALRNIDFGKLPVTEALPTFGNIGAKIQGGFRNILDSYKKRISSTYDSFINDVKKMNIVPEQYIERKIAASNSGAYEALKALEPVVGKPIAGGVPALAPQPSTPSATSAAPEVPTPTPAPEPTATATTPSPTPASAAPTASQPAAAPSAAPMAAEKPPVAAPTKPEEKPAASTPATTSPAPKPTAADEITDPAVADFILHNKALEEFGKQLKGTSGATGKSVSTAIARNIGKQATKAEVVITPSKDIQIKYKGKILRLLLRYKFDKDNFKHRFDGGLQVWAQNPATGKVELERSDSQWHPILSFYPSDIMDIQGNMKPDFDVYKLIAKTNPTLSQAMSKGEAKLGKPANYAELNKSIGSGLVNLTLSTTPDTIRGIRAKQANITGADEEPDQLRTGPVTDEPMGKPEIPPEMRNPPPDLRGKTVQPPKEKEPSPVAPVAPAKSATTEPSPSSTKLKALVPKGAKPKSTKPKTVAPAKPKTADKPVEQSPETAPETPPTPEKGKSMFGTDEERLDRVNKRYMIPNKLTPLSSIEQMTKFRSALGSEENPGLYKIQFAHQQATGTAPTTQSGPEKLKARTQQKVKEGFELRDFFP